MKAFNFQAPTFSPVFLSLPFHRTWIPVIFVVPLPSFAHIHTRSQSIFAYCTVNAANKDIKCQHIFMRCTYVQRMTFPRWQTLCGFRWITSCDVCMKTVQPIMLFTNKTGLCSVANSLALPISLFLSFICWCASLCYVCVCVCVHGYTLISSYLTFIIALDICSFIYFMQSSRVGSHLNAQTDAHHSRDT